MEPLRQPAHRRFPITDEADVGAARRAVAALHRPDGTDGTDSPDAANTGAGRAELAVTELATNLLRHAKPGGWILVRPLPPSQVEIIAVDRGPGIADPATAVEDRGGTAHGLGCGLRAVRRAAARFDLHTELDRGTAVLAVVELGKVTERSPPRQRLWGGVSVAVEDACGDGWAVAEVDGGMAVAVVDGLGHGIRASEAADAALKAFAAAPGHVDGFLRRANDAMRGTRGGAATSCLLAADRDELRYVSVGNVSGRLHSRAGERGLISYHGTLGLQPSPPTAKVLAYPWPPDALLVLWTDGVNTRVDLTGDPDLLAHDPAVVAAVLHRDHSRERDDATVVVVRRRAES